MKISTTGAVNLDDIASTISKRYVYVFVTRPWLLLEEWAEACGSLIMVHAETMHGFGTDPITDITYTPFKT